MEANKAEAERCVELADKCLRNGDKEKALKFLRKALKLSPSARIRRLIEQMNGAPEGNEEEAAAPTENGSAPHAAADDDYAHFDHYHEPGLRSRNRSQPDLGGARQRPTQRAAAAAAADRPRSRSRSGAPPRTTSSPQLGVDYSQDELDSVQRIRHSKDYYEILNVKKDFSESELKKQYRKLALQFHPDKCQAPAATEAFKAIGNAYAVLSNAEKRARYDMYGAETPATTRRHGGFDYDRGFESEFSPEEIFNMFFGGGFPSGQLHRRQRGAGGTYYYHASAAQDGRNDSSFSVALQLLPILILLFLSIASQFLIGDAAFSMHRNNKYTVERKTIDMRVTYYVKPDFLQHYRSQLRRVEQQVEDEYVANLRMGCYRERSQSQFALPAAGERAVAEETLAWRARAYGDSHLWERAQAMHTPSCDRLNEIYA